MAGFPWYLGKTNGQRPPLRNGRNNSTHWIPNRCSRSRHLSRIRLRRRYSWGVPEDGKRTHPRSRGSMNTYSLLDAYALIQGALSCVSEPSPGPWLNANVCEWRISHVGKTRGVMGSSESEDGPSTSKKLHHHAPPRSHLLRSKRPWASLATRGTMNTYSLLDASSYPL